MRDKMHDNGADVMVFADRLSKLLSDAKRINGQTCLDISRRLGITNSSLGNYARGKQTPSITVLARMSVLFGVSADWLIGLSDSRALSADDPCRSEYAGELQETIRRLHRELSAVKAKNQLLEDSLQYYWGGRGGVER